MDIMNCIWSQTINDPSMKLDKIRYDEDNKYIYVSIDCRNHNLLFQIKAWHETNNLDEIEKKIYFKDFTILNTLISRLIPD